MTSKYWLGNQSKLFKYFKRTWLPIEDDLKILKVVYLRNHLLDTTQILNLSFDDTSPLNEDDFQWKTTSKYQKWNISATPVRIVTH
jgi:hypothetical protein